MAEPLNLSNPKADINRQWPLPNVILGISASTQEELDQALPFLQRAPAIKRWLNLEPLLEPIRRLPLIGIDWVVVGGESGARARVMASEWVRAVRDACFADRVPFYFRQWGQKRAGRTLDRQTWNGSVLDNAGQQIQFNYKETDNVCSAPARSN